MHNYTASSDVNKYNFALFPGEYIYLNTRQTGGAAVLMSQSISYNSNFLYYCFTFWYYMHVSTTATLSVSWRRLLADPIIGFSLSGSQGNTWTQGFMDVYVDANSFTVCLCLYFKVWCYIYYFNMLLLFFC